MDRLKNLWWSKEENSNEDSASVVEEKSGMRGKVEEEEEEETGSLSTSGMTDSFTSGIENVVSSSRRASQSEISFQTASVESSQSDASFQAESLQGNQSDCDSSLALSQSEMVAGFRGFPEFLSRRASRSDVSSRRTSQSDFTGASRRSSRSSDLICAGAVVKGAAGQSNSGAMRYGVTSFDPYKRFDLQFVTLNDDLSNFYVTGARVWIPDPERVWRAAELLEDYKGQTTLKIQYEEAERAAELLEDYKGQTTLKIQYEEAERTIESWLRRQLT
ncbi:hypothetical protein EGW08_011725 [Elysia chlorotica]|uniref:Uncharacterized protein n=1 Tax=Elysia chlorotica TaxID=188477 RepID=A0A3S0ZJQ8_ELYCH|nr:hypothetical protein EGW08_011725 [Elysia chlorotica]